MRIIHQKDVERSEKLAADLKRLMGEGRTKRDKEIFDLEEELDQFREPWNKAFFQGRPEELAKLAEKINTKKTQKSLVSSRWVNEVNKISSSLEKLNGLYAPEVISEISLLIRGVEKSFNYSYSESDRVWNRDTDSYIFRLLCNLDAVNTAIERLISAKQKISRGRSSLSLKEILKIYDEAQRETPEDFPCSQEVIADGNLLSDFRTRREASSEPMLFEQHERYFSINTPNILGATLGKKQPLIDHFKK
jgi:hypothetical protein